MGIRLTTTMVRDWAKKKWESVACIDGVYQRGFESILLTTAFALDQSLSDQIKCYHRGSESQSLLTRKVVLPSFFVFSYLILFKQEDL